MIKRIILVVFSLVFLLGLVANAEHVPVKKEIWEEIPKERKFNLTTHSVLGDKELQIGGFIFDAAKDILNDKALKEHLEKIWPDRYALLTVVYAYRAKSFYPWKFTFIQGEYRYNPSTTNIHSTELIKATPDYINFGNNPFSGTIKPTKTIQGVISIPEQINLDKSFEVWYDDESTSMGG